MVFYFTIVFWTAGFDVIYSCQDVEFDLKEGLKSIPVRFGVQGARYCPRISHSYGDWIRIAAVFDGFKLVVCSRYDSRLYYSFL